MGNKLPMRNPVRGYEKVLRSILPNPKCCSIRLAITLPSSHVGPVLF
jgi:hypothetical protein